MRAGSVGSMEAAPSLLRRGLCSLSFCAADGEWSRPAGELARRNALVTPNLE